MDILIFFTLALSSLLSPISWIGYILSGVFIKNYYLAITSGIVWRLFLFGLFMNYYDGQVLNKPSSLIVFASLFAAVVATSIIYLLKNRKIFSKSSLLDKTARFSNSHLLFTTQWITRLFIVLQIVGIIGIIYIDNTTYAWDFFPKYSDWSGFSWDLLNKMYWGGYSYNTNWYVIICIFAPYFIAKSIEWIKNSNQ